jgi:hypothetical protein
MSKKNKIQLFAMKSVEEIADFMDKKKFSDTEYRDTMLLKIAFLLEDIREILKK